MNKEFHHLTNGQVLERLHNGDEQVFEWLYKQYWQKLYKAAYKRLKDGPVCEEIVQDIFTSLWVRRSTFQLTQSWDAYFYKAVQYKVINAITSRKVRQVYVTSVSASEADHSTENSLLFEDLFRRIEQLANQLPDRCRQVFWLSRRDNYSIQEIAQKLDISHKAVEKQLTKALKHLRLSLQNHVWWFVVFVLFLQFFTGIADKEYILANNKHLPESRVAAALHDLLQ